MHVIIITIVKFSKQVTNVGPPAMKKLFFGIIGGKTPTFKKIGLLSLS